MTIDELKKKAGRPRNDAQLVQVVFSLPEQGRDLHIEQSKKEGNRKTRQWDGIIIDETTSCYLVKLVNGLKESFDKNDFKYGALIYKYE